MKKMLIACLILIVLGLAGLMVFGHLNPGMVFDATRTMERWSADLSVKHLQVGDLDVAYLDGGGGEPLVLVHGFGADKDHWTRVSKYLTGHVRVIALDLPGFGDSTRRLDLDYSLEAQARRLHDVVAALGLSTIHLGGSSMGGGIAGVYASLYPDEVKSLWLVAPSAVNAPEESDLVRAITAGKNPLIAETPEDFKTTLDYVFYRKPFVPPAIARFLGRQAIADKPIKDRVFEAIKQPGPSLDTLLSGSTIPTLVLWGNRDRILHVSGAKVLCDRMAAATCRIMDDIGHLPMIEDPKGSAEAFLTFYNQTHHRLPDSQP